MASDNLLEDVPPDLANLQTLDVLRNPLSSIPATFRNDMLKVIYCHQLLLLFFAEFAPVISVFAVYEYNFLPNLFSVGRLRLENQLILL